MWRRLSPNHGREYQPPTASASPSTSGVCKGLGLPCPALLTVQMRLKVASRLTGFVTKEASANGRYGSRGEHRRVKAHGFNIRLRPATSFEMSKAPYLWKAMAAGSAALAVMAVFESVKQLTFKHLTLWESHGITIAFHLHPGVRSERDISQARTQEAQSLKRTF